MQKVVTSVVPTVGSIADSSISLTTLTPGKATGIDLGFMIKDDMDTGDELTVHLENFKYLGKGDGLNSAMTLTGTDGSKFDAFWTNGDYNGADGASLKFASLSPLDMEDPSRTKIQRASNMELVQSADLTVTSLEIQNDLKIDTRSPPQVKAVYTPSGAGPHFLGDIIKVSFLARPPPSPHPNTTTHFRSTSFSRRWSCSTRPSWSCWTRRTCPTFSCRWAR
jgi:hypothetical protein